MRPPAVTRKPRMLAGGASLRTYRSPSPLIARLAGPVPPDGATLARCKPPLARIRNEVIEPLPWLTTNSRVLCGLMTSDRDESVIGKWECEFGAPAPPVG